VLALARSLLCGIALSALAASVPVRAQDTMRILVGFPPGGGADLIARLAEELARRMAEDRARWAPIVKASGFSVDQ
jgi:tripartite-type tricarboxylate transporter receptor subunit TctC